MLMWFCMCQMCVCVRVCVCVCLWAVLGNELKGHRGGNHLFSYVPTHTHAHTCTHTHTYSFELEKLPIHHVSLPTLTALSWRNCRFSMSVSPHLQLLALEDRNVSSHLKLAEGAG